MNVVLSLYHLSAKIKEYQLRAFPLIIGRGATSDITLDDRWASRRHCRLDMDQGRLVVRDLGSKYGTFVNDCLVRESTLLPGDKLIVGLSTLIASYDLVPSQATSVDAHAVCDT